MAHLQRPATDPDRLAKSESDGSAALTPVLHVELRRIASRALRRERPGQTLQTTALVHEAYLRPFARKGLRWELTTGHRGA